MPEDEPDDEKRAIRAQLQRFKAEHGTLRRVSHTTQMTSFGGSGSTALSAYLRELGVDLPRTPGEFPFKHQRKPPGAESVPEGFRVVYPHADPRDAVLSIFGRGIAGGHYRGLRMRPPPPEVEPHLSSLEAFLEAGVDEFRLEDHVERWMQPQPYPVMFVRYEALESAWPELRDFLELPSGTPCLERRPRASDWRSLPPSTRERLDALYGPLAKVLGALPDAFRT